MRKIKVGLLAVASVTISAFSIRAFRSRQSEALSDDDVTEHIEEAEENEEATDGDEAVTEDVDDATDEAITAVKHTGGAVKHAGLATVKAVKARQNEDEPTDHATDSGSATVEAAESE